MGVPGARYVGTVTGWGVTGVGEWAVSRVPGRKSSMSQWQVALPTHKAGLTLLHSSMLPDKQGGTQKEMSLGLKCCQNSDR